MLLIPCWDGIDYALQNLSSAPGRAAINRSFKGWLVNGSGHYWNVSQGLSAAALKYWFIVRCSRDDHEKVTTSLTTFDDQEGEIASIYWCFRLEFNKLVSCFIAQKAWADTTYSTVQYSPVQYSTVKAGSVWWNYHYWVWIPKAQAVELEGRPGGTSPISQILRHGIVNNELIIGSCPLTSCGSWGTGPRTFRLHWTL